MESIKCEEQLKNIGDTASNILQINAEVIGVLKIVEMSLIEHSSDLEESSEIWAIRSAYRSLQNSVDCAFEITEDIEEYKRINK